MVKNAGAAGKLAALGARFGKLGLPQAAEVLRPVRAVPTIFPWVDVTLGVGGWPTDRFGLVHGPSNNGKSVFVLGECYSFVSVGHPALYLDAERTTPITWVRQIMGELADSPLFRAKKPASYEETVADVRVFCEAVGEAKAKGEVDPDTTALVVVDSFRKLMPQRLLDQILAEFGSGKNDRKGIDGANGMAARIKANVNAAWADELTALLDQTGCCLIGIGREYQNSDTSQWAPEYKLGGGSALFFEASVVVRVTESGRVLDEDKTLLATEHAVEIRKTKIAGKEERFPRAFFHLATGQEPGVPYGFDRARDVLALAKHLGLVTGGYYAFQGENLGQGEKNALRTLRSDPEWLSRIETACRLAKIPPDATVEVSGQEDTAVVQEGAKGAPAPPAATMTPRKRSSAGKAPQKGKAGKPDGKGSKGR
jgi:RecA/RadA recombinase